MAWVECEPSGSQNSRPDAERHAKRNQQQSPTKPEECRRHADLVTKAHG